MRPTQIAVGYVEVSEKREEWSLLTHHDRKTVLERHVFPAVIGPKGRHYIVDHHHLGLALLAEDVQDVWLTILDDMSWLSPLTFWRTMEFRSCAHPYDAQGRRCEYSDIPKQLQHLQDDPYRSLAGLARCAGGYAKDTAPFAEFLWADYFRSRVDANLIAQFPNQAVKQALKLARRAEARYLPGWTGEVTSAKTK